MYAVLLAGAAGVVDEALGALTERRPVPTLPVANVPLIAYTLGLLRAAGVAGATIDVWEGAAQVEETVRGLDPAGLVVRLAFARRPGGSADRLRRLGAGEAGPILALPGDAFLERLDVPALLAAHRAAGAAATVLATTRRESGPAYSALRVDEAHRLLPPEPAPPGGAGRGEAEEGRETGGDGWGDEAAQRGETTPAGTGVYLVEPSALWGLPDGGSRDVGPDLLPRLVAAGRTVRVVPHGAYYRRVTDARAYHRLNTDLVAGRVRPAYRPLAARAEGTGQHAGATPRPLPTSPRRPTLRLDPPSSPAPPPRPAAVDPSARVEGPVVLGEGSKIGREAVIEGPAVIGRNVTVGRGARLRRVVVQDDTVVGLAARFEDGLLGGQYAVQADDPSRVQVVDRALLRARGPSPLVGVAEQVLHAGLAGCLLLLLAPLLLLVVVAIRLESPGPVFYTQLRVGQRRRGGGRQVHPGQVFELIKFRTMYADAEARLQALLAQNAYAADTYVKLKDDPRVTLVGRLLRKTSIDELPQLINVVKGEMRLVGNRPLPLYEASQLSEPWQQVRFGAPAGMTGLWQVSGRSDLSREERMILDNYYAVSRSFWMDVRILCLTLPAVLLQRGSY